MNYLFIRDRLEERNQIGAVLKRQLKAPNPRVPVEILRAVAGMRRIHGMAS
jgi:hypothetical protein